MIYFYSALKLFLLLLLQYVHKSLSEINHVLMCLIRWCIVVVLHGCTSLTILVEPTSRPAEVIGEDKTYVVVTLGAPTILQCYAVGWPPPTVTWWRGDRMLPLSSEQFEQRRDYSLLIRSVTLRNLGPYTCQAYNGYGRAASWTVTVQAVGPVYSGDSKYNEYLVPAPKRPEIPETEAPTERPSYPYRPVRPPPQPQSRTRPPFVQPTSPPEISPHPEPELTPRVFIGKQTPLSLGILKYGYSELVQIWL